ncbi:hypothetical protein QUA44_04360 [Microcoleus sp. N9_A2]|uniref:hypothetical protein n=2 Tax=Microcoleus TaxID=44471 RepID=UPI002FCFD45F
MMKNSMINYGKRILLGQLGSNGDCLYTTILARQIKQDYPNCHLTWAISSICKGTVEENPFVDEIWEIPLAGWADMAAAWYDFENQAKARAERGDFDEIFLTQIYPNNFQNYDGTVRPSIFRAYPKPITVPIQNILRLRSNEVEKVQNFAKKHNLQQSSHVILFECASKSGQSFVTPNYALYVAQGLISKLPDCQVILSSNFPIPQGNPGIIDGSTLTMRETAELTKYCHLFIGCSSGITQIALTDWAKPLPMIQLLSRSTSAYGSIAHDFEYWGLSCEQILEMTDVPVEHLIECTYTAFTKSFSEARRDFHQPIVIDFNYYLGYVRSFILQRTEQYFKAVRSILYTVERYGWHPQLKLFVQTELIPKICPGKKLPVTDEDYSKLLQDSIDSFNKDYAWADEGVPQHRIVDALSNDLGLRDINLIIFPDWSQSEELIAEDLESVIKATMAHPDKSEMTLLIDTSNISDEDANLVLSSVAMNLLMEEDLDVSEGPEISLMGRLSEIQWETLMTCLDGRIILENENKEAIAQLADDNIPSYKLDRLSDISKS